MNLKSSLIYKWNVNEIPLLAKQRRFLIIHNA